jgi:hypothetical protein
MSLGFNLWNPFNSPYRFSTYPVYAPVVPNIYAAPGYFGASTLVVHPHHHHHAIAEAAAAGYAAGAAGHDILSTQPPMQQQQ